MMMERNDKLIKRKFYSYLFPGIMMVAAMQLGNLVDSIFIGNLLGSDALSASNLGLPVVYLAQIPLLLLSVGGSTVAAIGLGKREMQQSDSIFTASMFLALVINLVNAAASLVYCMPLARFLAGGGSLTKMTYQFMLVNLLGIPLMGIGLMISYFMGVDNHPMESAGLHITANVINLVTDYIYIRFLGMGIIGAAFSTVTGYGLATIIFGAIYLRSEKRTLRFTPGKMFEKPGLIVDALKTGLASAMLMILSSCKMFILNGAILAETGETGMALYAVCVNSFFIVQLCLHGISGVIQTMVGVLYGEKDYYGIRSVLKRVIRLCIVVAIALVAIFIGLPGLIEGMFGFNIPEYNVLMDMTLRIYALSFIGYAFNNILQIYYSTIEKPFYATLDTVMQGFVIIIPATLILLSGMGIVGTSVAAVIAETGAILVVILVGKYDQKRGKATGKTFDMLPEKQAERFVDATVEGNLHDAVLIAHQFRTYCLEEGVGVATTNNIAVIVEELIRSIAGVETKKRSYIDLCLVKEERELLLRVRDDGPVHNPLDKISAENKDAEVLTEIQIVKKQAKKMDYSRILNMNTTVVGYDIDFESQGKGIK